MRSGVLVFLNIFVVEKRESCLKFFFAKFENQIEPNVTKWNTTSDGASSFNRRIDDGINLGERAEKWCHVFIVFQIGMPIRVFNKIICNSKSCKK